MSTEIIDFKSPSKLFKLEVRGFVVLSFDLHRTTLDGWINRLLESYGSLSAELHETYNNLYKI